MTLTRHLQPSRLLPNVTAGLVSGILIIIVRLSLATLIFSGPLANYVASGIGLILFGSAVMGVIFALTSSFPGAQAAPQDTMAAVLALIAAVIGESMSTAPSEAIFATVIAAIAIACLLTGVLFLLLGRFKLGSLVRFVPYPVIGGFMGGTGWLLVLGAMGTMIGSPLNPATIGALFHFGVLAKWLPGILFAILLWSISRRYSQFWIMPALLAGAVAIFYAVIVLTNTPLDTAAVHGWLLGPFPQGSLWQPITPAMLAHVDWSVLLGQTDKIGTVFLIGVIALLLNSSGLELAVRQDIDLNRELQAAGIANLLAGLAASPPGYLCLSPTVLSQKMAARGRVTALVAAALSALVLVLGTSVVSLFPRAVLGGLLFFTGLQFLSEWLYDGWFKLPRVDYALVLVILAVVAGIGFIQGVLVGLAIAIVLFVVNYSRINVVRQTFTGAGFHSTVDRPPSQRQFLREHGGQLWALQLQGYLFFGTAQRIFDQVRQRALDPDLADIHFLLLDLSRVSGLDSSAVSSFIKLEQFTAGKSILLILAHVSPEIRSQLELGGLPQRVRYCATLDGAVEWCEEQILTAARAPLDEPQDALSAQFQRVFGAPQDLARFMRYLDQRVVGVGEAVVCQGEPADALYFIASGSAAAQFQAEDGRTLRLRTMRSGTIIGEAGLYTGSVRSASVSATEPSVLYRLSLKAIREMQERDPDLAAALHEWIARLMAERLAENNNLLAAMMD